MSKLESIIGGNINSYGGIDVNYKPTGFNIDQGGSICEGYRNTGFRITGNGSIRDHYNNGAGVHVNQFDFIKRDY